MDKARLAREFSPADWLTLAEAWRLLFFFHVILHWTSYERLMIATPPVPAKHPEPFSDPLIFARHTQRLVGYASRLHLIPITCLVRSLTLQKMLHARNIPAQLHIGVNKTLAEIHAHAWVEVGGEGLGESKDIAEKFKILSRPNI